MFSFLARWSRRSMASMGTSHTRSRRRDHRKQQLIPAEIQLLETRRMLSGAPVGLGVVNQVAVSTGVNPVTGHVVVTAGTAVLHDYGQDGITVTNIQTLTNGTTEKLIFEVQDAKTHDVQLWSTDGTAAGTVSLRDFGTDGVRLMNFQVLTSGTTHRLAFELQDPKTNDVQFWTTDGTLAGTSLLHDAGTDGLSILNGGQLQSGKIVFGLQDTKTFDIQLWVSDGSTTGTKELHDFGPSFLQLSNFQLLNNGTTPRLIFEVLNYLPFSFNPDTQFWSTDGTAAGTSFLRDAGADGINIVSSKYLTSGTLLFALQDLTTNDLQLWATDGTAYGTTSLYDFGTDGVSFAQLQVITNGQWHRAVFEVTNFLTNDVQMWSTDGTTAGTKLIRDAGTDGIYVVNGALLNSGTGVFAVVDAKTSDAQLWVTDSTSAGTKVLHDFGTDKVDVENFQLLVNGTSRRLVFSTLDTKTMDFQGWSTDGTVSGTTSIHDFGKDPLSVPLNPTLLTSGKLVFGIQDLKTQDVQLWVTDGSSAGTIRLHDFGTDGIVLLNFQVLSTATSRRIIFEVQDNKTQDVQLWSTDGTAAGTILLKDAGTDGVTLINGANLTSGKVVFGVADRKTLDVQLWTTDGTTTGTVQLHDFGSDGINLTNFKVLSSGTSTTIVFGVQDAKTLDTQLWSTNGTASGTANLHDFGTDGTKLLSSAILSGGKLIFGIQDTKTLDVQLWATDGTRLGTTRLHDFGTDGVSLLNFQVVGGTKLTFVVKDAKTTDVQLWTTDGTAGGTVGAA